MTRVSLAVVCALVLGCPGPVEETETGTPAEEVPLEVTLLFVMDASSSMEDEAAALAFALPGVLGAMAGWDLEVALTTLDAGSQEGALMGSPALMSGDDIAEDFTKALLCEATCINASQLPGADPDWECGDPVAHLTRQYLDCLCGEDAWMNHCGSGQEEGLESVYQSLCRAVDSPPAACFTEGLDPGTQGTNAGLVRGDVPVVPVVVTDEGDGSRRLPQGEGDPSVYRTLLDELGVELTWVVVGPSTTECNTGGATTWGVDRYQGMVDASGGAWVDIATEDDVGYCQVADLAAGFAAVVEHLEATLD